jgi:serine/threonine protein phosphatase PrpC
MDGVSISAGDVKSSNAVKQTLQQIINETTDLKSVVENCDKALFNHETKGLLSTIVIVKIDQDFIHFVSIGDSRIYEMNNKKLTLLTEDDIKLLPFIQNGKIVLSKQGVPIYRSSLSKALGGAETKDIRVHIQPLNNIEAIILASDGIYGHSLFTEICTTIHFSENKSLTVKKYSDEIKNSLDDDASLIYISINDPANVILNKIDAAITTKNVLELENCLQKLLLNTNIKLDKDHAILLLEQTIQLNSKNGYNMLIDYIRKI